MISFLRGTIYNILLNSLIIDVNGVGYEVFVANSERYKLNDELMIYTHQYVREDENSLYGFSTLEEKQTFIKLISVKGIGVKTAMGIMSRSSIEMLTESIETGNVGYLKTLPGIGPKAAQQIILDLKGKLKVEVNTPLAKESVVFKEAKEALRALNFKVSEIDRALASVKDENISVDVCILKALQFLNKK